jgi:hypothetical protein
LQAGYKGDDKYYEKKDDVRHTPGSMHTVVEQAMSSTPLGPGQQVNATRDSIMSPSIEQQTLSAAPNHQE